MGELVVKESANDIMRIGEMMAKSGYFQDASDASKACVKIMAGAEVGLPPIASMTGIHIIKGRVSMGANLMAALIKKSGKYNYRVLEMTDVICEIAFFEEKEEIGRSRFTAEDARKAGTQNLDKYPRNMLFARAMSNGAKWYCADVFGGPIYTPEELRADDVTIAETPDVDTTTGEVIEEHKALPARPARSRKESVETAFAQGDSQETKLGKAIVACWSERARYEPGFASSQRRRNSIISAARSGLFDEPQIDAENGEWVKTWLKAAGAQPLESYLEYCNARLAEVAEAAAKEAKVD